MKVISSSLTYISLAFLTLFISYYDKKLFNILCKSWKQASWVRDISDPGNGTFRTKKRFFVLLATACKTYIGSVLFRTSTYTGAKQASRVPFWFRDLSCQNHLVPGYIIPFFRPGHLVPLFGSPRPIFYNRF